MSEKTEVSNVSISDPVATTGQVAAEHKAGDTNVGSESALGADKNENDNYTVPPRMNKYYIVVAIIIGIVLALGFWYWWSIPFGAGASKYPIAWFIIVGAILGSIVNEPFRESLDHQPTYGWTAKYIVWKGAVSIVFAFLLYFMAVGGLIGGDLFPKFTETALKQGENWNMELFITNVNPETYKDIAKILVWSFIAGYSEKFVPNLISKLLKTPDNKDNSVI